MGNYFLIFREENHKNFAKMMKGDDKYVTKMTHFPKPPPKVAKKPPPVQQIQQELQNLERRVGPGLGLSGGLSGNPKPIGQRIVTNQKKEILKSKKRVPDYDDGNSEPAKVRKKSADDNNSEAKVTPMKSKIKPLPKVTNFRTLKKEIIPERLKMGRCRCVTEFEKLNRIGEGTYGIVYRARDIADDQIVALKKVRMEKERDGMPISSIREISILFDLKHENIVELKTVAVGQQLESLFLVMSYCHYDLASLLDHMAKPFTEDQIKCLIIQVLKGLAYSHSKFVVHRDLKVSNLLMTDGGILKLADFGLSRSLGYPRLPSTPKVVTLWYRAPEVLFGSRTHSAAMDLWSTGCVLAELLNHNPLFPARNEMELFEGIINTIGSPNETI